MAEAKVCFTKAQRNLAKSSDRACIGFGITRGEPCRNQAFKMVPHETGDFLHTLHMAVWGEPKADIDEVTTKVLGWLREARAEKAAKVVVTEGA